MQRRIGLGEGRAALAAWTLGARASDVIATAVRFALEELAARAPGASVEVRVPPYGAVQCVEGARHTRGTPPSVVEADADTWLRIAVGDLSWDVATATGALSASGARSDLADWLPLFPGGADAGGAADAGEASPEP